MIRRPPRSTLLTHSYPTRRSSDLKISTAPFFTRAIVDSTPALVGPSSITSAIRPSRLASTCRSEEHTSELQSLMRISYAVFCLNKNNKFLNRLQSFHINNNIAYHDIHYHTQYMYTTDTLVM